MKSLLFALALIVGCASEEKKPEPPKKPPVEKPKKEKPKKLEGSMYVTSASGKPGDIVTVYIKGNTNAKINGYAFAMGTGRLKVINVSHGEYFNKLEHKYFYYSDAKKGYPEPFIKGFLMYYGLANVDFTGSNGDITGKSPAELLPADTILVRVDLLIPSDARPGKRTLYFNKNPWFKNSSSSSNMLRTTSMFTTERQESRHGVVAKLSSGYITVLK